MAEPKTNGRSSVATTKIKSTNVVPMKANSSYCISQGSLNFFRNCFNSAMHSQSINLLAKNNFLYESKLQNQTASLSLSYLPCFNLSSDLSTRCHSLRAFLHQRSLHVVLPDASAFCYSAQKANGNVTRILHI